MRAVLNFRTFCVSFCFFIVFLASILRAQSAEEFSFVHDLMARVQKVSFAKHREYCGFIGLSPKGVIMATPPRAGTKDSCELISPPAAQMRLIASYHSHGAFDLGYENELPSVVDIESDRRMGLRGWVSTPGGRLWHIDPKALTIAQVCGVACLPVHARFYKSSAPNLRTVYSFDELHAYFEN